MGSERAAFVWQTLAPRLLHPVKLTIIESMLWFDHPLSPSKLAGILEDPEEHPLGTLSYHMRSLMDAGVLEQFEQRAVRGSMETFYFFPAAPR